MNLEKEKKLREYDKKYQRKRREMGLVNKTEEYRQWRIKNPGGNLAHSKVNYRIKKGLMQRGPCALASEECSKSKTHAHHKDYQKPLEVVWLCPSHHKKVDLGILELK